MIIKHPRLIIKQHGTVKNYRYVGDISVSNQLETLTALELFFRHTRRLKMQTPTFSFSKISLSTIGKGLDNSKLIFPFICICILRTSFVLHYLYLYSVI